MLLPRPFGVARNWRIALLLLLSLSVAGPPAPALAVPVPRDSSADQPAVAAAYGKLPLSFESNQGQASPDVAFLAHGGGYSLLLQPARALLGMRLPASADPAQPPTSARLGLRARVRPSTDASDARTDRARRRLPRVSAHRR